MVTRAPTRPTMPKAVKNIPSSQNWTVLKVCNVIESEAKGGKRGRGQIDGRGQKGGGRGWQVDDCAGQGLHSLPPAVLRLNAFVFSHSKAQRERGRRERDGGRETDVCAHARKRRVHKSIMVVVGI